MQEYWNNLPQLRLSPRARRIAAAVLLTGTGITAGACNTTSADSPSPTVTIQFDAGYAGGKC